MKDQLVLAACLDDRKAFERVRQHVDVKELSPPAQQWWPVIVEWYERDARAVRVDRAMLRDQGTRRFSEKHRETLAGWFDDLPTSDSPGNVVFELLELKRQVAWAELEHMIHSGAERDKVLAAVERHAALMRQQDLRGSEEQVSRDYRDMFRMRDPENLVRLHPAKLNERADGGAVDGDHILIFGRTEAGKTLVTVNLVAGMLRDGHKVLYICNEESFLKTQMRIVTNLLKATPEQVRARSEKAIAAALERGLGNLDIRQLSPGSVAEIEERVEDTQPRVVVIDQIRNLTSSGQKLTNRLEDNATAFRALLSRHHCVGVSVTQANDRTERHGQEPPMWLATSDIDSSRTGLPGQCDLIVGVGATEELKAHGQRAISLPKNKMGQSHEGFMVSVDTLRSIVT